MRDIVEKLKKGKVEFMQTEDKVQQTSTNSYIISQIKHLEHVTSQLQYDRMMDHMVLQENLSPNQHQEEHVSRKE